MLLLWLMLHLTLIPVIALFPDLTTRQWLREAFVLAIRHPLASIVNAILTAALVAALVWLPRLAPFASAAVVGFIAFRTCEHHLASDS